MPDPHPKSSIKDYERKQAVWLFVTYVIIAIMTAALMLYAALSSGTRPHS